MKEGQGVVGPAFFLQKVMNNIRDSFKPPLNPLLGKEGKSSSS